MMQGRVMALAGLTLGVVSYGAPLESEGRRVAPNVGMALVEQQLAGDCSRADIDHPTSRRDYECKHLRRALSLDDAGGCLPSPSDTFLRRLYGRGQRAPVPVYVLGVHRSVWITYRYGVDINANGDLRVYVYVHFRGSLAETALERASIEMRFAEAERIWERSSPLPGLKFRFLIAEEPERAHFSVDYRRGWGRGPYNFAWYSEWDSATVAHELGHMMGLHDEYSEFGDEHFRGHCDYASLMCSNAPGSEPRRYHYYTILRRVHCAGTEPAPGSGSGGGWPFDRGSQPASPRPDPGLLYRPGAGPLGF